MRFEMLSLKRIAAVALFAGMAGCTHEQTLTGPASVAGLQQSAPEQGLEIEGYGKIPPTATLSISLLSGRTVTLLAEQICRGPEGLFQRPEGYSECSRAVFVAAWSDIRAVHVEELDRLSTTLVVAGSALIVAGAILMASSGPKSNPSGPSSAPQRHTPANPRVNSGSQPQPLPPASARPGAAGEQRQSYDHSHTGSGGSSAVFIGVPLLDASSGSGGASSSDAAPAPQEGLAIARDARTDLAPLYTSARERRASLAPFVRAGADVCAAGTCAGFTARAGARIGNLFELSGGILLDRDAQGLRPMGLVGAGFHGGPPGVQWVALYVGTNAATDGASYRVSPEAGVRFELTDAISLGVLPAAFSYRSRTKQFNYTPAVDLGILF
jgi:hypothetical protein